MTDYFPISLDVRGQRCVVVGAGGLATRTIEELHSSGALIHVVANQACHTVQAMAEAGTVTLAVKAFEPSDLDGARLAIAATNDWVVNGRVAEAARARGALVHTAPNPVQGDFILPSVVDREPIQITVSAAGCDNALSSLLRKRVEEAIGPEYAALALLLSQVKQEASEAGLVIPPSVWQRCCDDYLLDLLSTSHHAEALHLLRTRLVASTLAAASADTRDLRSHDDDVIQSMGPSELTGRVEHVLAEPVPA